MGIACEEVPAVTALAAIPAEAVFEIGVGDTMEDVEVVLEVEVDEVEVDGDGVVVVDEVEEVEVGLLEDVVGIVVVLDVLCIPDGSWCQHIG